MEIKKLLKQLGFTPLDRQEKEIALWKSYFQGNVEKFHSYTEYQGAELGSVERKRKTLGMPKVISELWADNIINPETKIVVQGENEEDTHLQEWWDDLNETLGIEMNLNDLMELSFALGTGATVQSVEKNGQVIQQYINIEHIYPLKQDLKEIVDCAFVSVEPNEIYIQVHLKQENGSYLILNRYFDKEGEPIEKEGVEEEVTSEVKLFQLYKPAIVNNINIGSPLGVSIFANTLDESKSIDITYDGIDKEVRNGRTRVYVRGSAIYTNKGNKYPIFNKDQDEFYVLPEDEEADNGKDPVTVKQGSFNTDPLITALEKHINLMGSKCGLGDNAFYAKDGTIYTNTEQVVSSNSKFYKTRQKHATRIEKSLVDMVKALFYLDTGNILEANVYVDFDDSIIHDTEAEYNRSRLEVMQGLKSHIQHFMDVMGLTQEEAENYWKLQLKHMALKPDVEEEGGEV